MRELETTAQPIEEALTRQSRQSVGVSSPCAAGNCVERDVTAFDLFSPPVSGGSAFDADQDAPTVEELLEEGLALAGASPVHLAFRGTAQEDSVRCEWRGVARTPEQREEAVRFWLDLDDDEELPSASEVERRFMEELDRIGPIYPETVRANFRALARGDLSTDYTFLTCYADYTVHEYLLGSGSTTSTAMVVAMTDGQRDVRTSCTNSRTQRESLGTRNS